MSNQTKSQFVAVASITSELTAVMVVAKEISLAAANAKAIAFRAGDKAKGFQPITDFINELAKETIELVTNINVSALLLYRVTVNEYRRTSAYNRFQLAAKLADTAVYTASMEVPVSNAKLRMDECQRQFKRDVALLLGQLETVMHHARAARVIAANSRIEASQAGEYLQNLQAVAESVDKAAHTIHDNVQRCRMALSVYHNT
ncbi:MAG: chemotaxis protein [Methylobacter sp.]|nr:chemotaxis protein [Methylobacter sp.]